MTCSDAKLLPEMERYGVRRTGYEGPGSFATYLLTRAPAADLEMASLVAEIPGYLQGRNPMSIEAVTRRLRLARLLDHPGAQRVCELDLERPPPPRVVLDPVAGPTLAEHLAGRLPLPALEAVALALDLAVRDGRVKPGHNVLMEGVGGGFTWGAILARM